MEDFEKTVKQAKVLNIIKKVVIYGFLSLWALMILFPFYWMIMTSFKSFMEYNNESVPNLLVSKLTLENYQISRRKCKIRRF